jgi:hypothetical protein
MAIRLFTRLALPASTIVFATLAQAATPALVPTNLPGVQAYAPPPKGFDPFTATPEWIAAYGYPARPERTNTRAYTAWARAIRAERTIIIPRLRETDSAAGAALHSSALHTSKTYNTTNATSQNWSATILANNAVHYGTGSFYQASAWWEVPPAHQAIGVCTLIADHLFTWVGIDGWWNNEVFQAGTESNASCSNGITQPSYAAWYEWYPNLSVQITNLPVTAGDFMSVIVMANSNTNGTAWVENAATGVSAKINFNAPSGTTLVGNSAEWVQERPTWNGKLSTLANYGAGWFSLEGAELLGSGSTYNFGNPGSAQQILVTMLDNNHQPISYTVQLDGASTMFVVGGSAH